MKRVCEVNWNGKKIRNDFGNKGVLYLYFFEESPLLSHEIVGNTLPHSVFEKTLFGARMLSLQTDEKVRCVFWRRKIRKALNEYTFTFPFEKIHQLLISGFILVFIISISFFTQADTPVFTEKELFQEITRYSQEGNNQQARASFVLLKTFYSDLSSLELIDLLLLKSEEKE